MNRDRDRELLLVDIEAGELSGPLVRRIWERLVSFSFAEGGVDHARFTRRPEPESHDDRMTRAFDAIVARAGGVARDGRWTILPLVTTDLEIIAGLSEIGPEMRELVLMSGSTMSSGISDFGESLSIVVPVERWPSLRAELEELAGRNLDADTAELEPDESR